MRRIHICLSKIHTYMLKITKKDNPRHIEMHNLSVSSFLDPVHLPIFFYIIVPYANEKHTFALYSYHKMIPC